MPRTEYEYKPAEDSYQSNLPRVSVDTNKYRRGSTDSSVSLDVTDNLSVSSNYQNNTDGGKDNYGARLTLRKNF